MKKINKKYPKGVSIVIPVYNEDLNILSTLIEIKKHIHTKSEILIVYDFDKDTTIPIVRKVKNKYKNLKLIKNNVSKGPSGAIRTGIKQSKYSFVLVTMADLCDDLSQVEDMIKIASSKADIISPSRYSKGGKQELKKAYIKVWAPRIAGAFLKVIAGLPTYDPTNSFKLYKKVMLDRISLRSTVSFSVTLEIVVKANAMGFLIYEIPTVWKDRQNGKTNFKLKESLIYYLPWFFYAIINRNPGK